MAEIEMFEKTGRDMARDEEDIAHVLKVSQRKEKYTREQIAALFTGFVCEQNLIRSERN